jgi:hypothetical protein
LAPFALFTAEDFELVLVSRPGHPENPNKMPGYTLLDMNQELLSSICQLLDYPSQLRVNQVCKALRTACTSTMKKYMCCVDFDVMKQPLSSLCPDIAVELNVLDLHACGTRGLSHLAALLTGAVTTRLHCLGKVHTLILDLDGAQNLVLRCMQKAALLLPHMCVTTMKICRRPHARQFLVSGLGPASIKTLHIADKEGCSSLVRLLPESTMTQLQELCIPMDRTDNPSVWLHLNKLPHLHTLRLRLVTPDQNYWWRNQFDVLAGCHTLRCLELIQADTNSGDVLNLGRLSKLQQLTELQLTDVARVEHEEEMCLLRIQKLKLTRCCACLVAAATKLVNCDVGSYL